MIVNDGELLPLGSQGAKPGTKPAAEPEPDMFSTQITEAFDSVDLLLAARAEAEVAEALAKSLPETPLPFAKEDRKKGGADPPRADGAGPRRSFSVAGAARDEDSPAPIGAFGEADLRRLSDATSVETGPSLKDFMRPASDPRARHGAAGGGGDDELLAAATGDPGVEIQTLADIHIDELLKQTVIAGASDLHLTVALPPMIRKDGKLVPLAFDTATERDTQRIVYDILTEDSIEKFERTKELDFSYGVKGVGRFRFNVYRQRGSVGLRHARHPQSHPVHGAAQTALGAAGVDAQALRTGAGDGADGVGQVHHHRLHDRHHQPGARVPYSDDRGPDRVPAHAQKGHGQPAGTGDGYGHVQQRPAGRAARGPGRDPGRRDAGPGDHRGGDHPGRDGPPGLRHPAHAFRTGHGGPHRGRVPAHQQEQIRIQLSTSLEAVVAQQLLPKLGGGRVSAIEIMIATSALRNLIREGKSYQIYSVIETGQQHGMQAMDRVLADLHRSGQVTFEEAATRAIDRENFNRLVKGY